MSIKLKESLILIVEDVAFNRILLKEIFESAGFNQIIEAENGQEALEEAQKHEPKIIILDISMPVMDGLEFCQKIRKIEKFKDTPIIIQTASSESDEKAKAFEAGATDFVAKPIDERELIARTKVHLEKIVALESLKSYKQRTAEELLVAKQMQNLLMPSQEKIKEIEQNFNISLKSFFKTSSETGGDFWGCDKIDDKKLAIYMTDFSGHGVQAALNTFRIHTLMLGKSDQMNDPASFLESLNNDLKDLLETGQYATMFYGIIDFVENNLTYATAAPTIPLVVSQDKFLRLENKGFPLGMVKGSTYENRVTKLGANEALFLYSDALIETEHHDNNEFLSEEQIESLKNQYVADKGQFDEGFHDFLLDHFVNSYAKNIGDDLTTSFYFMRVMPPKNWTN